MCPAHGSNESRRYSTVSKTKEAVRRFIDTMEKSNQIQWARKTRFIPQPDGSLRRLVTRKDGTEEKDEIIPTDRMLVAEARA
jgi:putative transcriptional regulator